MARRGRSEALWCGRSEASQYSTPPVIYQASAYHCQARRRSSVSATREARSEAKSGLGSLSETIHDAEY